jgi:hypothetical protein
VKKKFSVCNIIHTLKQYCLVNSGPLWVLQLWATKSHSYEMSNDISKPFPDIRHKLLLQNSNLDHTKPVMFVTGIVYCIRGCIQKFPDWPSGARATNDTALCHKVQLYRHFMSQSSEFCRHNALCCFLMSIYCYCCLFHYRLGPKTFGYTLIPVCSSQASNYHYTTEIGIQYVDGN